MKVSRRVAQIGLVVSILILLASMAIVFVGSTQGKQQNTSDSAQAAKYVQHADQQ